MAKRRKPKHRKRRARKTAVDFTVWARGEKIESCVHFGECLDVSWDRFGFSICPINPPSPIDPVPIDIGHRWLIRTPLVQLILRAGGE